MRAWDLDYESLRAVNPQLVMLSTSLMGQTGPLAEFAGFGNLAGAISGFYELTGWPDRAPAGPFLAYTDYVAPRYTVTAPAGRARLAPADRLRPAPRPVAGRGVDPLPRPGDPRPRRQRRRPDASRQRRRLPPPARRVPLRRRRCVGGRRLRGRRPAGRPRRRRRRGHRGGRRGVDGRPRRSPRSSRRCRPPGCRSTGCRTARRAGAIRS